MARLTKTTSQAFVFSALLAFSSSAGIACPIFYSNRTPLFETEDLIKGADGPIIIELTIKSVTTSPDSVFGLAKIERVIKGSVNSGMIHVIADRNGCAPGFSIGASGIVIGTLSQDRNIEGILHCAR